MPQRRAPPVKSQIPQMIEAGATAGEVAALKQQIKEAEQAIDLIGR